MYLTLLWLQWLYSTRFLCPWDFPGKNTGVGYHFLLQVIFPPERWKLCLLHCQADSFFKWFFKGHFFKWSAYVKYFTGSLANESAKSYFPAILSLFLIICPDFNHATVIFNSWQIDGKTMKTVRDFIFLGSKITADVDCSYEINRCLLLGRKAITNLDNILKSRDITLLTKVHIVKAVVFQESCMDMRVGP